MDTSSLTSKHHPPYTIAGYAARAWYVAKFPEVGISMLFIVFSQAGLPLTSALRYELHD